MILTEEQQAIIGASKTLQRGQTMLVDACAGSGKTSTLTSVALANPQKRFLYLAFNRSIVEEAQRRFTPNVDIMTTHSLAFRRMSILYGHAIRLRGRLTVHDVADELEIDNYTMVRDILTRFNDYLYSDQKGCSDYYVNLLLDKMHQGSMAMTHDVYLKDYQLLPRELKGLDFYDCILLDEAQDTNPATVSIFMDNSCARILVGDTHQSIYAFRGAINALETVTPDLRFNLTYSFRSTQEILNRANFFIKKYDNSQSEFHPMKSAQPKDLVSEGRSVILTRTNAAIVEIISAHRGDKKDRVMLLKDPEAVFQSSLNVLKLKHRDDDFDPEFRFLRKFRTISELEEYADSVKDLEILTAIKIVNEFGDQLNGLFEEAKKMKRRRKAGTELTTVHSAKGLEWDSVILHSDFPSMNGLLKDLIEVREELAEEEAKAEKARARGRKGRVNSGRLMEARQACEKAETAFRQELNLLYVAITRAKTSFADNSENYDIYPGSGTRAKLPAPKTRKILPRD